MTADTFSSTLGILRMATGNDNNLWGDNFNNQIGAILERAIAGVATTTVTGGTLDLSSAGSNPPNAASQMVDHVQIFTGTLTSDQTVIVPAVVKSWLVINRTSGNFGLLFKTPTGATTSVPQLDQKLVINADGNGNLLRLDRFQIGEIFDYAGTAPPIGALECDGSAVSRTRYPELFLRIGSTWGDGDHVSTFNLPNLTDTGRFRRSRTASVPAGAYQSNDIASHGHAGSGLSGATDPAGSHNHGGSAVANATGVTVNNNTTGVLVQNHATGISVNNAATGISLVNNGSHSHSVSISDPGHANTLSYNAVTTAQTTGGLGTVVTSIVASGGNAGNVNTQTNISNLTGSNTTTVANGDHTHTVTEPNGGTGHNHGITEPNGGAGHNHAITDSGHSHAVSDPTHAHTINADGSHTHPLTGVSVNVAAFGGAETRPEAAVVISCIRV